MQSVGFGDSSVLVRSMEYMYSLIMYMSMHSIFAGFLLFYTTFYKRVGVRITNFNEQLCSLLIIQRRFISLNI